MTICVGILGVGSIGGSIGLRAIATGANVLGYDPNAGALTAALEARVISASAARGEVLARADVLVIAAPVDATIGEIAALRESPRIQANLIIDVASVKAPIALAAQGLANFVATHPMAGSERSGPAAACADTFEARNWLYVPPGDAALEARLRTFVESMGAIPVAVDAVEHDRIVALTSHVPQLAGSAYARVLRMAGAEYDPFCGPVARELLRVSRMSFTMWRDILAANASNVEPHLRALAAELLEAADALRDGETEALCVLFPER